jgi:hypothetical protein
MIRPPTVSSESDYANRSRPSHGSRCMERGNRGEASKPRGIYEQPDDSEEGCQQPVTSVSRACCVEAPGVRDSH